MKKIFHSWLIFLGSISIFLIFLHTSTYAEEKSIHFPVKLFCKKQISGGLKFDEMQNSWGVTQYRVSDESNFTAVITEGSHKQFEPTKLILVQNYFASKIDWVAKAKITRECSYIKNILDCGALQVNLNSFEYFSSELGAHSFATGELSVSHGNCSPIP